MAIPKIAPYPLLRATQFPANQVSWEIDPQRAVVLVHDMQTYFLNFFDVSQPPVPALTNHIARLTETARAVGVPVVYTAQPIDQDSKERALLTDFWGHGLAQDAEIIRPLTPQPGDVELVKWRYSAFKKNELQAWMQAQHRDQLIICGVYGHIGILSTALEAFMLDIQPFLVGDAIADFSETEHRFTLNYIAGRAGVVQPLETTLTQLTRNHRAVETTSVTSSESAVVAEPHGLSLAHIQQDVAQALGLPLEDVDVHENLLFLGLDSIRAMTLLDKWQQQGVRLTAVQLMEHVTLYDWWQVIEAHLASDQALA